MSIIDIQRRIAEVGRLRIGRQVETQNGGKRPTKLDTWRVTSSDRQRIEHIAGLYGGKVEEWQAPAGKAWEVITETDHLPVIVPPADMAFSMWYEQWGSGGCLRRCDGQVETISDGPCLCDPDERQCDIHTRLSVMLRDVPGLGVYRLDTSGYYAATELQGAVGVVTLAASRGALVPARLRLEQRSIKRQGSPRMDFAVPVLDLEVSPAELFAGTASMGRIEDSVSTTETAPRILDPVPPNVLESPVGSVAEQASTFPERKPRSNAAQPIPETGVEPRTVDEVESPAPSEDAWGELISLLGPDPKKSDNMDTLEADLRRLFRLMEACQVPKWQPDSDGVDALHRALKVKHGADHVGDLKKAELYDFCVASWGAARDAVKAMEGPFE